MVRYFGCWREDDCFFIQLECSFHGSVSKFVERVGLRGGFHVVATDGGGRGGAAVADGELAAVAARTGFCAPGREAGQYSDHAATCGGRAEERVEFQAVGLRTRGRWRRVRRRRVRWTRRRRRRGTRGTCRRRDARGVRRRELLTRETAMKADVFALGVTVIHLVREGRRSDG